MFKVIPTNKQVHCYTIIVSNPNDVTETVPVKLRSRYTKETMATIVADLCKYPFSVYEVMDEEYFVATKDAYVVLQGLRFYKRTIEHRTRVVEYDEVVDTEL